MPDLSLPFKVQPTKPQETVDIGDAISGILPVPKYGCLKVAEEIAIAAYFTAVAPETDMSTVKVEVATILLQSRFLPEWTLAHTKGLPDFGLVEKLYEFILKERSRWAEKKPEEEAIAEPESAEDSNEAPALKKPRIGQKSGLESDSTIPLSNATTQKTLAIV